MIDGIKYLLASIVVSSLFSCSKQECITHPDNSREAQFVVSTKADAADRTKTSLSGNQLCWIELIDSIVHLVGMMVLKNTLL